MLQTYGLEMHNILYEKLIILQIQAKILTVRNKIKDK